MTTAARHLWIAALCILGTACASDDGGSGGDMGGPDGGGDPDVRPDGGTPTEQCADTCDGCCDGDSCMSGESPSACGTGGAACEACDPGFVCALGACTVDRTSRWDVLADSADVFEDNAGGTLWDTGGLPDTFVRMKINDGVEDLEEETGSRDNTLAPSWNDVVLEEVPAGALVDSGIETTLLDDDPFPNPSDSMGTCIVTFDDSDFTGDNLTAVCQPDLDAGRRGWTLRLRLIRK
jgi:hypothetical protein